jgi:hypothetical protein
VTGTTSDGVEYKQTDPNNPIVADVFDLGSYFEPSNSEGWIETTYFGGMPSWKDTNGDIYDFFFFWFGGEEPLEVKAIIGINDYGQPLEIRQWISNDPQQAIQVKKWNKATGTEEDTQKLNGVAFSITALKDQDGESLTEIQGLRFTCKGMSPACVCAVKPPMGILREITLTFTMSNFGNYFGWGDTWIDGTYKEEITGLIKKPILVEGSFLLKHINRIEKLSD